MADDHEILDECKRTLEKLKKALFGNGEPEQSVITRLCILEKKFSRMEKTSYAILVGVIALLGNLVVGIAKHQMNGG